MSTVSMLVRAFFFLLLFFPFFLPLGVSFEVCTVGPSFFPTCAYVCLPNECSTRFVIV